MQAEFIYAVNHFGSFDWPKGFDYCGEAAVQSFTAV